MAYAGVDAGDPIAERVHAGEFWVCVGHVFECGFAALQFLLERSALGPADFDEVFFGVLSLQQHRLHCPFHLAHQLFNNTPNHPIQQQTQQQQQKLSKGINMIKQVLIMQEIKQQTQQQSACLHNREELILGSFILHAHRNHQIKEYVSCHCDKECVYVLMNDIKKIQAQFDGDIEQRQLFDQHRNNGHPQPLTKLILRQNLSLQDVLIELYSTYMHLEINQTVFAELLIETKFQNEDEKYEFQDSCDKCSCQCAIVYEDCGEFYKFSIFVFKTYPKRTEQKYIYVKKQKQQTIEQAHSFGFKMKPQLLLSKNEFIVFFSWILRNKYKLNSEYKLQYDKLIKVIQSNSKILQNKINQIRQRSFTLLYDFSQFYSGFT